MISVNMLRAHILRLLMRFGVKILTILSITHCDTTRVLEVNVSVLEKKLSSFFTFGEGKTRIEFRVLLYNHDLIVLKNWTWDQF